MSRRRAPGLWRRLKTRPPGEGLSMSSWLHRRWRRIDLGIGAIRRDDEPERVLEPVTLLRKDLRLVLKDDAGDVPRRRVGQVAIGEMDDLVIGDGRFAAIAAAAGRGKPNTDDDDSPFLGGGDPLLLGSIAFELPVVV